MRQAWWWPFAAMMICVALFGYCNHQAMQLADLKTGNGDIEAALNWSRYAVWFVGLGAVFGLLACCLQPYCRRWEKLALIVCFICIYGIFFIVSAGLLI